jgi:hypothetical protein
LYDLTVKVKLKFGKFPYLQTDDRHRAVSALNFLAWGPGLDDDEFEQPEHLERWLHLERAAALNSLLASCGGGGLLMGEAKIGEAERQRMEFLVGADAVSLREAMDAVSGALNNTNL